MYKKKRKIEAKSFIYTRKTHETENAEDYVELIEDLIKNEGEARVVDIAKHLGISKATVNQTINRLIKKLQNKKVKALNTMWEKKLCHYLKNLLRN